MGLRSPNAPFDSGAADRRFRILLALAYLTIGTAVYAGILTTYFVADDFSYLDAIQAAVPLR